MKIDLYFATQSEIVMTGGRFVVDTHEIIRCVEAPGLAQLRGICRKG